MAELIEAAGGLKEHAGKVISGGPMMGFALFNLHVPCVKTLFFPVMYAEATRLQTPAHSRLPHQLPDDVSVSVLAIPARLATFAQRGDMESFQKFDGMECCECICCHICPAKPLTQSIGSPCVNWFWQGGKRNKGGEKLWKKC